jgi:hypothetical protein
MELIMTKDEYVKLIVENSLRNPEIGNKIIGDGYGNYIAERIVSFVEEVEQQIAKRIAADRIGGT